MWQLGCDSKQMVMCMWIWRRGGCPLLMVGMWEYPLQLTHRGRDKMAAIFKCIFFNENVWISIKISLKFVPKGLINNISSLVQIMAWRCPGDKPLSEPMMVNLLTNICVTQPQCVNSLAPMEMWQQFVIRKHTDYVHEHFLWNCSQVNATEHFWWDVNTDSGNGLVPFGNKALLEPMLTQIYVAIWCYYATMS